MRHPDDYEETFMTKVITTTVSWIAVLALACAVLACVLTYTGCAGDTDDEPDAIADGGAAPAVAVKTEALTKVSNVIDSDDGAAIFAAGKSPLNALRCYVMANCIALPAGTCPSNLFDCFIPQPVGSIKSVCQNVIQGAVSYQTQNCTTTGCDVYGSNGLKQGSFQYGTNLTDYIFAKGVYPGNPFMKCMYPTPWAHNEGHPNVYISNTSQP